MAQSRNINSRQREIKFTANAQIKFRREARRVKDDGTEMQMRTTITKRQRSNEISAKLGGRERIQIMVSCTIMESWAWISSILMTD